MSRESRNSILNAALGSDGEGRSEFGQPSKFQTPFMAVCSECRQSLTPTPNLLVCPDCSEKQEKGGVTRGVLELRQEQWPDPPVDSDSGLRSWVEAFMALGPSPYRSPNPVGSTPLVSFPQVTRDFGVRQLYFKDDSRNPSGSTKDRASELVISRALTDGRQVVATASTGNAATALAAMAAGTSLQAVVFVPASAPVAKIVQMRSYGARVIAVDGTYDDAFQLCNEACDRWGWYNRNTGLNPFTIEGKKTAALEIAAQWPRSDEDTVFAAPDVVLVPTGDGVILSGVAKGFEDLHRAGWISRPPRLIAVQPEGSAALTKAWIDGLESPRPHQGPGP